MRITNIPETWSAPVTLTANETWQCIAGVLEVSVEAAPATPDGLQLYPLMGKQFLADTVLRYRRVGRTAAILAREAC